MANIDVFTGAKIVLLDLHKSIYWSIDHLIKYLQLHYKKNPASFNHLSEKKYVKRRCNLRFLIQCFFLRLDGTIIPQGSYGSFLMGSIHQTACSYWLQSAVSIHSQDNISDMRLPFFKDGIWYRYTHKERLGLCNFNCGFTKGMICQYLVVALN